MKFSDKFCQFCFIILGVVFFIIALSQLLLPHNVGGALLFISSFALSLVLISIGLKLIR
jgi:hypothetical protein